MNDNQEEPITPGCPSLMPHNLPGGFDGVEPGEDNNEVQKTIDALRNAHVHAIAARLDIHFISDLEHLISTAKANV